MGVNKKNLPASHTMELPRKIVVGEKNIDRVGEFLKTLSKPQKVSIISGKNVKKIIGKKIDASKTDYNAAMNKLVEGKGNLITSVEKIKKLGAKAKKSLPDSFIESASDNTELP